MRSVNMSWLGSRAYLLCNVLRLTDDAGLVVTLCLRVCLQVGNHLLAGPLPLWHMGRGSFRLCILDSSDSSCFLRVAHVLLHWLDCTLLHALGVSEPKSPQSDLVGSNGKLGGLEGQRL